MRYQKISRKVWDDEKFRKLSIGGKLVFLYLLGNKNNNLIGFYVLRHGYAASDLNMAEIEFDKCLREILQQDLIMYDEENAIVLLKNYLVHNYIYSPPQLNGARNDLQELPRTELLHDFREILARPEIQDAGRNSELLIALDARLQKMSLGSGEPEPIEEELPKPETKKINIEGFVDTWNQFCFPPLSQVLSVSKRRETAIRCRMTERPDLEEWKGIFQRIVNTPFLRGENKDGWRADFDWVLKPDNLQKILEGKYEAARTSKPKTGMDALKQFVEERLPHNQFVEDEGGKDDNGNIRQGDGVGSQDF